MLISSSVIGGSSRSNSLKIFSNAGTILIMMNVKMPTATDDDDDRVDHRAFDFALRAIRDRSWKSARRCRMTSSAPPASPALIMLTYRRLKTLGALGHRFARASSPPSISSHESSSEFLSRPGFCCPSRIRRLRRIGRPASCRIESCRVNVVEILRLHAADGEAALLLAAWPSSAFLRRLLDRDLRDEVAHLANRRLGFFFGRRLDHVLDLRPVASIASN